MTPRPAEGFKFLGFPPNRDNRRTQTRYFPAAKYRPTQPKPPNINPVSYKSNEQMGGQITP
jgi:hypothetical protein